MRPPLCPGPWTAGKLTSSRQPFRGRKGQDVSAAAIEAATDRLREIQGVAGALVTAIEGEAGTTLAEAISRAEAQGACAYAVEAAKVLLQDIMDSPA